MVVAYHIMSALGSGIAGLKTKVVEFRVPSPTPVCIELVRYV